jgi:hypothetical protein
MSGRLLVALLVAWPISCAPPRAARAPQVPPQASAAPQPAPDETRPGLRHAIYAAHLREMMSELDYLATSRLPEELESDAKRDERLEEIGDTAEALAYTAADLVDVLDEVRMSDGDSAYFRELAGRLRVDALMLQDEAKHGEIEPAKAVLSRITSTCDACHTAFRIIPEALDRAAR